MLVFWSPFWGNFRLPLLVLLLVGLYVHIRSRQLLPTGTAERRWGLIFLLLALPALASTTTSINPRTSLIVCAAIAIHYWVGLALLNGLRRDGHVRMAFWIGLTLLFWCVDGAVQWVLGYDLFGNPLNDEARIVGPFVGNLRMGLFIAVLAPLWIWPLIGKQTWLALLSFLFMATITALSGVRADLVYLFLAAGVLIVALKAWPQRLALILICLAPILVVPHSPALKARVHSEEFSALLSPQLWSAPQQLFETLDTISSHRLTIWQTASHMVRDRPWLGVGPGTFDQAYPLYATRADDPFKVANTHGNHAYHAHQMYVSAAAETGLLGFAGLVVGIVLIGRWYWRSSTSAREAARPWMVCLAVIAFPINSQPVLFAGWWFPIVMLLLCGMLAALNDHPETPPAK